MPQDLNDGLGQRVQGGASEASIDAVNQWMRSAPWYRELLASMGVNPDRPVHLTSVQKQQIVQGAQQHGVVVDEGDIEVDDGGNFNPKGHKLRNTLIVAGIAAASIATMGAAGVFSGAATAPLASTTAGTLAGIEGAPFGLTAAGAAGLGTATAVPALAGGATGLGAAGAGALAESAGPYAMGTGPGLVAGGGISPGVLGTMGSYLDKAGTMSDALGGWNRGLQQGRENETLYNQRQDRNAIDHYTAETNAARLNLLAPQARGQTSVQGDILANAKPFSWTGSTRMVGNIPVPQSTGGLSPDLFSDNTRALGNEMSANALADNRRLPYGDAIGSPPSLTPVVKAGTGSNILSGASAALNLWNAVRGTARPR